MPTIQEFELQLVKIFSRDDHKIFYDPIGEDLKTQINGLVAEIRAIDANWDNWLLLGPSNSDFSFLILIRQLQMLGYYLTVINQPISAIFEKISAAGLIESKHLSTFLIFAICSSYLYDHSYVAKNDIFDYLAKNPELCKNERLFSGRYDRLGVCFELNAIGIGVMSVGDGFYHGPYIDANPKAIFSKALVDRTLDTAIEHKNATFFVTARPLT